MNEQLLKTSGADVLSSRKNIRKTLKGGGILPPLPLYVRGLNCQVVEGVDIFANPVFKNPGTSIILRSLCEVSVTLSYPIMSHQVSPLNTAAVSKCSKCRLRQIKFAKFPGGA